MTLTIECRRQETPIVAEDLHMQALACKSSSYDQDVIGACLPRILRHAGAEIAAAAGDKPSMRHQLAGAIADAIALCEKDERSTERVLRSLDVVDTTTARTVLPEGSTIREVLADWGRHDACRQAVIHASGVENRLEKLVLQAKAWQYLRRRYEQTPEVMPAA